MAVIFGKSIKSALPKDDEALEERGDVMLFNLLDEKIIVQEMQIVTQMNHRVRDPVYHYILAWPLEEKPGPGEIRNCVSRTLAALGLRAHQACAIGHSDTASYHVGFASTILAGRR